MHDLVILRRVLRGMELLEGACGERAVEHALVEIHRLAGVVAEAYVRVQPGWHVVLLMRGGSLALHMPDRGGFYHPRRASGATGQGVVRGYRVAGGDPRPTRLCLTHPFSLALRSEEREAEGDSHGQVGEAEGGSDQAGKTVAASRAVSASMPQMGPRQQRTRATGTLAGKRTIKPAGDCRAQPEFAPFLPLCPFARAASGRQRRSARHAHLRPRIRVRTGSWRIVPSSSAFSPRAAHLIAPVLPPRQVVQPPYSHGAVGRVLQVSGLRCPYAAGRRPARAGREAEAAALPLRLSHTSGQLWYP